MFGTVHPWRNRDGMGVVLDKSELVGPFGGKPTLPISVEGARSDSHVLEVHGESLQEIGGGWESKLPGDRGDGFPGLSGGCGDGDEKNRGSGEGAETVERRRDVDTGNGVGSPTSNTVSRPCEKASKGCGHGEEVQEKAERNFAASALFCLTSGIRRWWNKIKLKRKQKQ
jgi:hypothetical protein